MTSACLTIPLILLRFIEKARQDQQTPYALPAWDKAMDKDMDKELDDPKEGPKVWDGQGEPPNEQN